jgi:SAM-dependent methyltransferase
MLTDAANGWLPGSRAQRMRQSRMQLFAELIRDLPSPVRVLDVGGLQHFWLALDRAELPRMQITFVNMWEYQPDLPDAVALVGDARDMSRFADREFDVVFSNSVIEHVGGLREQARMARECVRVGKRYFVQTPNRAFPIEPHFLFPGFQFLPLALRARLHQWRRWGWWDKAGGRYQALEEVESIRLLTRGEMRYLFPDATIWTERLLGLPKSFVAHGHNPPKPESPVAAQPCGEGQPARS